MKRITLLITLLFSFLFVTAQQIECYTIAVGKKASATGHVLVAHNEDDYGNLIVNIHRVPRIHQKSKVYTLVNGDTIPQKEYTFGYLWFETTQQNFGDMLVNDNGVAICSNACRSREDTATGILTYDFRRLVAQRALNARHAVMVAGELIEKYGYGSSGRTYCFADSNEVWLMAVVKGRHWVAQRVPDTAVAIVPNYYTIGEVNLKDKQNFMSSPDLIDYAIKRGWYDTTSGKPFNFRLAYSDQANLYAPWNIPRHWSGINQLADREYSLYPTLPFAFKPYKKMDKHDLMGVLSSHYEGTDFETHRELHPNPHKALVSRICNTGTKFSAVVEYSGNIKNTIVWWAPLNPCINPYIPIALSIAMPPKEYFAHPWTETLKYHFDKEGNRYEDNPDLAFSIFKAYTHHINQNYWKEIKKAQKFRDQYQQQVEQKIYSVTDKARASAEIMHDFYLRVKKMLK